jgi:putative hydrolase of the HAD superfamily
VPCLRSLRDLRLAVLSDCDQAQQEDKLRGTGLAPFFEVVLTSGSLGSSKPYPETYRLACKRLSVEPDEVMYVGDRLDVDAQASTAAGLHEVWLDRATSPGSPYQPAITTLRQLPGLVAD